MRCYITDEQTAGGRAALLRHVERAVTQSVTWIQVREKQLSAQQLADLVRAVLTVAEGSVTKVLVNSRLDVALACGAHGLHLPSHSPAPARWQPLCPPGFLIGVSCHTEEEVQTAAREGANYVFFSPVFASPGKGAGVGLLALQRVARAVPVPVWALGGVTAETEPLCRAAGAAGIAAVRMFQ